VLRKRYGGASAGGRQALAAIRREHDWPWWRGSKELLLHIARLAAAYVGQKTGRTRTDVPVVFALRVGDDVEWFAGIEDFRDFVTPEGLRNFDSLELTAATDPRTPDLSVQVLFRRGRPAVHLLVVGDDTRVSRDAVEEVAYRLGMAVNRGLHQWDVIWRHWSGRVLLSMGWITIAGLLTRWRFPKGQWQSLLLLFGGGAAFFVVWGWLLPVVEIAPRGQSRFEVFRRTVIAITVG
jgi:hypothetical protein